jgi:hypothetical protein
VREEFRRGLHRILRLTPSGHFAAVAALAAAQDVPEEVDRTILVTRGRFLWNARRRPRPVELLPVAVSRAALSRS